MVSLMKEQEKMPSRIVLGVTGGVGAGKSTVLEILEQAHGALLIRADDIGHEVIEPGAVCYEQVVNRFGRGILRADGTIDRQRLYGAAYVAKDGFDCLNAIIHPAVRREVVRRIEESNAALLAVEAALFYEARFEELVDEVWYVDVPVEERIRRLAESRGYDRSRSESMMARQLPRHVFLERADVVIDNGQSLAYTKEQIAREIARLRAERTGEKTELSAAGDPSGAAAPSERPSASAPEDAS